MLKPILSKERIEILKTEGKNEYNVIIWTPRPHMIRPFAIVEFLLREKIIKIEKVTPVHYIRHLFQSGMKTVDMNLPIRLPVRKGRISIEVIQDLYFPDRKQILVEIKTPRPWVISEEKIVEWLLGKKFTKIEGVDSEGYCYGAVIRHIYEAETESGEKICYEVEIGYPEKECGIEEPYLLIRIPLY